MTTLLGEPGSCLLPLERFDKEIWGLRPRGNYENCYINLELKLRKRILLPGTSKLLTFELVSDKWRQYLKAMKNEQTKDQFIRGFQSWMDNGGYLEDRTSGSKPLFR